MSNRKRKGREVSGWLCIDKDVGRTSTQVVGSVKRLFNAQKVGHAGTLDPLASGILPIALGDATKTVPFVQDSRKTYRFTVEWGAETDTDDADGKVVATSGARPSGDAVRANLAAFTGEIMQRPPAYSAIKIGGERAYDLAREGEAVVIEERPVTVHRLDLVAVPDAGHAVFEAECGKGTYVRAIARDLGRSLGCLGHVVALRRLAVGAFDESAAIGLEALIAQREEGGAETLDRFLMPLDVALGDLPEIAFHQGDASRIRRGQSVILRGRDAPAASGTVRATFAGETLAIGEIERGEFHPKRVFRG
ncbi:MAG: tRNA pseudouridine(55) synthase TruB [Bauldia sp.]|nr:MAG: tRNA pseudouridine(55) synthase TruB [Bauldia sp.]MBZ0227991.1 tRNA pseudouridine(55) synthase TruB [Bauldia sp.]